MPLRTRSSGPVDSAPDSDDGSVSSAGSAGPGDGESNAGSDYDPGAESEDLEEDDAPLKFDPSQELKHSFMAMVGNITFAQHLLSDRRRIEAARLGAAAAGDIEVALEGPFPPTEPAGAPRRCRVPAEDEARAAGRGTRKRKHRVLNRRAGPDRRQLRDGVRGSASARAAMLQPRKLRMQLSRVSFCLCSGSLPKRRALRNKMELPPSILACCGAQINTAAVSRVCGHASCGGSAGRRSTFQ